MSEREGRMDDFLKTAGWEKAQRQPLPGDASFRRYVRLRQNGQSALLMDAPPPKEDVRPFLAVARHLKSLGLSAPAILALDIAQGFLLLEDFGDATFTRRLAEGASERALYELATDLLIAVGGMERAAAIDLPSYDDAKLMAEARLLTDWYMPKVMGRETPAPEIAAYEALWLPLFEKSRRVPASLVLRDYHVDNLMTLEGRAGVAACGLLDFQDALIGPVTYDLMSLVEDARRDLAPGLAQAMRERYLAAFAKLDRQDFDASMAILAAQRHCKVIGIFTRLLVRDGKPVYLRHIPRLWRLLEQACDHPDLAELKIWLDRNIPASHRGAPS